MAQNILTATDCPHNVKNSPLLYQDIPLLVELFRLSYEDYGTKLNLEVEAFVAVIRRLVEDHVKPICQQNPQGQAAYQIYHDQFKPYARSDFRENPRVVEVLTFAIAHLVHSAIESFKVRHYPKGYTAFLELLEKIFNNDTVIQQNKQRPAYILLEQLRQKP